MTKSEIKIKKILNSKGFTVLHNGWPDFFCIDRKNRRCLAIEAKTGKCKLSPAQKKMHRALKEIGLPTYVTYGVENLNHAGREYFSRARL